MATTTQTEEFLGTGRRKSSSARVRLKSGDGSIEVNGKPLEQHFSNEQWAVLATAPLQTVEKQDAVSAQIRVAGGGYSGQAEAVALGIARALEKMDPNLRTVLKKAGHLTRDGRVKERKKPGQPGARKKFQYSKR